MEMKAMIKRNLNTTNPLDIPVEIIVSYDKLWKRMKEMGLTKNKLRYQVPISYSSISKMKQNIPLTPKVIKKLCTFFNCPESEIIDVDFY